MEQELLQPSDGHDAGEGPSRKWYGTFHGAFAKKQIVKFNGFNLIPLQQRYHRAFKSAPDQCAAEYFQIILVLVKLLHERLPDMMSQTQEVPIMYREFLWWIAINLASRLLIFIHESHIDPASGKLYGG